MVEAGRLPADGPEEPGEPPAVPEPNRPLKRRKPAVDAMIGRPRWARPLRRTVRATPGPPPRRARLGLRARVTLTFAVGALTVSSALAAITYFSVRRSILGQQEVLARAQAIGNALLVSDAFGTGNGRIDFAQLSNGLNNEGSGAHGSPSLLDVLTGGKSRWMATPGSPFTNASLGAEGSGSAGAWTGLTDYTLRGDPAEAVLAFRLQEITSPYLLVGIPLGPSSAIYAVYFEIFDLSQVSRTLHVLIVALAGAAIVTTFGGVLFGLWASGRALRPLAEVSRAALDIARGRFGTRLETIDASDLAVLASSFNRMADRLEERIARDAQFASDVSHELRSPLTTLTAAVSVLESRRADLPERARVALDLLAAEIRRFRRMVDDLLEISRLDSGPADLALEEVSVGDLIRNIVAEPTRREIPVDLDTTLAQRRLLVDKRRFERIISNLVENAAHYAGGATRISVEAFGGAVRFAVEDEGPGIPAAERHQIFERFARGSAAGRRGGGEGTGLGLALVAEHVRLHGGHIWVEGVVPHGARFVVELPLLPDEGPTVPDE